ncbi:uncharacterized protein LOC125855201 [Solanum stenotomum]|uniref:uncharacterized protein LOC125855201 n=1 Tax=Solanum stenotomum TaxID=172797 RepID=UPI0020D03AF4|nr:uncharacterized protein LOC125855201 [Solanum stenotomum]
MTIRIDRFICKANKNSDKTIADMMTIGFTGQLKGWWNNYLNTEQGDKILQVVNQEREQNLTQNVVYTIVLNIIEHFSRRWSDNSEIIRTMLQNLKCKTLTSFRFYKDVFLSRVMELPECNSSNWKYKFIDGLPALFDERVRKTLRGDNHSINYDNYTYGKLINAYIQEGLSLCNEIKLKQQVKRHRLNEREELGEFCEQFALDIPKASSKDRKHSSKNKSSKKDYKAWKKRRIEKKERRVESYKEKKRFYKSRRKFDKTYTCHMCGIYGHYARDCRVKKKNQKLDIDDNIKEFLCKIMLNFYSGKSETGYSSHEKSSTSEDLKALH